MSHPVPNQGSWYQSVGRWLSGKPKRQQKGERHANQQVTVEHLETRQLLSASNSASATQRTAIQRTAAESTAADTGTTGPTSSSTTSTTHGVDANGNPTTTTTITTTTTDANGNTTTSSTSTTTVDGTATLTSTSIDTDQAIASVRQANGKLILVGTAQINTFGNYDFAITRINEDGSLDTTFGSGGKKTVSFDLGGKDASGNLVACLDAATCVALQTDGKIVVGGYAQRDATGNFDFAVVRLNTDGTLDTSFSSDGKALVAFDLGGGGDDRATGIAIQSDGKIILTGSTQMRAAGDNDFAIARLRTDGSLDTTFSGDGRKNIGFNSVGDDRGAAVVIQPDGKIIVVGYAQASGVGNDDFAIARLTSSGNMDSKFGTKGKKTIAFDLGGARTDRASAVALQADGKILIAGSATSATGDGDFAIVRLKSSGSLDKSFSNDSRRTVAFNLGANNEDQASGIVIQSDGKILLGGFSQVSATGDFDFTVARITTDGELDTSFSTDGKKSIPFNMGGSDNDMANGLLLQPDGKIVLIGHALKTDPANTDFAAVRIDTDGQLDTSFGTIGLKTIPFDLT